MGLGTKLDQWVRAGGTGPVAPDLAGLIFQAPTIHCKLKPKKEYLQKRRDQASYLSSRATYGKTPF